MKYDGMALKFLVDTTLLLLHVECLGLFSNQSKIDGMVNNYFKDVAVTCSDF